MKEILYTKFNSTRKPEYQVSTSIVVEDGKKYVVKKAIQYVAEEHLKIVSENAKKIESLYSQIKVVSNKSSQNALVFPFITGKSLLDNVDFANDSLEEIVEKVKNVLIKVNTYNPEYMCDFEMTDAFATLFENCNPKDEKATTISNVDGILGNFVETEDGTIWSIDYEWVLDFPVPIRFVIYRSLLYLYTDYQATLERYTSLDGFFKCFDFTEGDINLFQNMEECFQHYVHGKNREYIYVDRYKKTSVSLETMQNEIESKKAIEEELRLTKNHANNLEAIVEQQQSKINKMKKAIKNPLYAVSLLGHKLFRKDR